VCWARRRGCKGYNKASKVYLVHTPYSGRPFKLPVVHKVAVRFQPTARQTKAPSQTPCYARTRIYNAHTLAARPAPFTFLSSWGSADYCPLWGSPREKVPPVAPLLRRASWGSAMSQLRCPAARYPAEQWVLRMSHGMGCAVRSRSELVGRRLSDLMCLRLQAPYFSLRAAGLVPPPGARPASHLACCLMTVQGFLASCPSCVAFLDSTRSVDS
jgi:hypothetical protein